MPFIPKSNANFFFFFLIIIIIIIIIIMYPKLYYAPIITCPLQILYICQKNYEICAIKLFKLIDIPRYYNATLKAWHSLWMWSDYQFESMT